MPPSASSTLASSSSRTGLQAAGIQAGSTCLRRSLSHSCCGQLGERTQGQDEDMPLGDGWEPQGGMSNSGTPALLSTSKRKQTALEQGVFFPLKGWIRRRREGPPQQPPHNGRHCPQEKRRARPREKSCTPQRALVTPTGKNTTGKHP